MGVHRKIIRSKQKEETALLWIPVPTEVEENKIADNLEKKEMPVLRPKCFCEVSKNNAESTKKLKWTRKMQLLEELPGNEAR